MQSFAVFGIYSSRQSVEAAVEALKEAGFRASDISVLAPENLGDIRDLGTIKSTKAPEGATAGGALFGLVGGILGWLVGIGVITIPGLGQHTAAGPIVLALAGLGAGAVLGGIIGALAGMSKPEYEVKRYQTRLGKGGILLSVHADNRDWITRGKGVLSKTGAERISSGAETRAA